MTSFFSDPGKTSQNKEVVTLWVKMPESVHVCV